MWIEYDSLRVIWWGILGFLMTGFGVLGGIDLGCGMLLPFVTKTNNERKILLHSIKGTWESNQVWFITGGGVLFAAWPYVYSVVFSTMYFALFAVLVALILRPVGFDYRSKIDDSRWRSMWDKALFIGGFVPTLVFGVAIGNLMEGVNFAFDNFMVVQNKVSFFSLFSPFSLLCGVLAVAMLSTQGSTFLMMKTDGDIARRARKIAILLPFLTVALFAVGGYMVQNLFGYKLLARSGVDLYSNPMGKAVAYKAGAWLENYTIYPWMRILPISGFLSSLAVVTFALLKRPAFAFLFSSLTVISIMATFGLSMFPFIVPSKLDYHHSLTVWDSSSSYLSLLIMLGVMIIFMPIVLCFIGFANKVMFGKVTEADLKKHDKQSY